MFLFCTVSVSDNFVYLAFVWMLFTVAGFSRHKKRTADCSEVLFIGGPRLRYTVTVFFARLNLPSWK